MDQVCGMEPKVIAMSANGNMEKQMEQEYITGSMEIDTKDSLDKISNMDKALKSLFLEISTKDLSGEENLMVSDSIFGPKEVFIRVNLLTVIVMVTVFGRKMQV